MVRFIISKRAIKSTNRNVFTFQYGQIYYDDFPLVFDEIKDIYIPIWLDLL